MVEESTFSKELNNIEKLIRRDIPEEFKNNKEFVEKAVSHLPIIFEDASPELKNDPEFILKLTQNRHIGTKIIEFISDELKNNKVFMLPLIARDGSLLKYASRDLKQDRDIVIAALKNNEQAIDDVDPDVTLRYPEIRIMMEAILNQPLGNTDDTDTVDGGRRRSKRRRKNRKKTRRRRR